MKKLVAVFCMAGLSTMLLGGAFGADENKSASPAQQQPVERMRPPQGAMPIDKNIAFISGSISKIDATVPENVKVEVFNDVDGKSHVVEIGIGTNILKVAGAGELKVGDKARVVARKAGDKEIALSIVTGKLKELHMPRPAAPPALTPMENKAQTKK